MAKVKMIKAFREAFDEELARDEKVCLFGEDVGKFGGVFGTSSKLQAKYGERRVFDTPLSESAIVGTAVGAAMAGLRPIAEIMYLDFITVAMDPLINQAAKISYMSNGRIKLPMVIFTQCGAGTSEAAQHSQCLEAWFVHTPGLKVVMPATVYDAKGLMKSSIRDNSPVVFIWHKMLYDLQEDIPDAEYLVPLGQARTVRKGADITVVATSYMVHKALAAATELAGTIDVELIDPRTLAPLDIQAILDSVSKTKRLLVVQEAAVPCSTGSEIVRQVVENSFDQLVTPPRVLGSSGTPVPFAHVLEAASIPQQNDILDAIKQIVQ